MKKIRGSESSTFCPMQIADRWMKATNFGEERVDLLTQQVAFGAVEDFALSTGYFDNVRIWFNNKVLIMTSCMSNPYII